MEPEAVLEVLEGSSARQSPSDHRFANSQSRVFLELDHHRSREFRFYLEIIIYWRWALGILS